VSESASRAASLKTYGPIASESRFIEIQLAGIKLCEDYTQVFETALQYTVNDANIVHHNLYETWVSSASKPN